MKRYFIILGILLLALGTIAACATETDETTGYIFLGNYSAGVDAGYPVE